MPAMRFTWRSVLILSILVTGATLAARFAVNLYESLQRASQVGTHAAFQSISDDVRRDQELAFSFDEVRLEELVDHVRDGRDSWGNEILVGICTDRPAPSYLLVSTGADGVLDVASVEDYCDEEEVVAVGGNFDRDIVFRDGKAVRSGGK